MNSFADPEIRTWPADPGIGIPAEAAEIHGVSIEHARRHGQDTAAVVAEVAEVLAAVWRESTPGQPICTVTRSAGIDPGSTTSPGSWNARPNASMTRPRPPVYALAPWFSPVGCTG
jgi:hypothetical protein